MADELDTRETNQENHAPSAAPAERRASSLPLTLTLISLLIWFGFQTVALVFERNQLRSFKSNYDAAMQEAQKMQAQLEALITKTAELASKGNANAKAAIEDLQKRGIPVQPATPPVK
jgi:uncharacterized protein YoxC